MAVYELESVFPVDVTERPPFKIYKDDDLRPRQKRKIKTRKRLIRDFNDHYCKAKLKPRLIMMYASETDLP